MPLAIDHVLYEEVKTFSKKPSAIDCTPHRNVLRGILYIATRSRSDIATAVSLLAKFQEGLAPCHCKIMQLFVMYLIGTRNMV